MHLATYQVSTFAYELSLGARRSRHATDDQTADYQTKVTLRGSEPPIWQRSLISAETPLVEVHDVLQMTTGWTDSHFHQFPSIRRRYGIPDPEWGCEDLIDESGIQLGRILTRQRIDKICGTRTR